VKFSFDYIKNKRQKNFLDLERFYEDPEKLFQTLNVANPYMSPSTQLNPLSPAIGTVVDPMLIFNQQTTNNGNYTCRT
jgi:hypothetical protein